MAVCSLAASATIVSFAKPLASCLAVAPNSLSLPRVASAARPLRLANSSSSRSARASSFVVRAGRLLYCPCRP
ncbi:hypothetical protein E2562_006957 [Oryza meyeriana var. granulata]|uniref:Uncharacterized protein n=1 Tax=Oryza meyeriana var. granulata TaxID=110450 RepID=A0A6G1E9I0_9ORYZ|nr:hypothetical protein E2562_006957 [Oryza meyeriana var. granulata]